MNLAFDARIKKYLDGFAGSPKRPQSYLFFGPEGSGKTEAAYYLIRKIAGKEKDAEFSRRIEEGIHPDVILLAPEIVESKSGLAREREITIREVRKIQAQIKYLPYELEKKFCLIKKAEKLNLEAGNALLKMLEEPTRKTFFILLATSAESVLPTVVSRCAQLGFFQVNLPGWQEENRDRLRKIFLEEIYEKFGWAEKISKNSHEAKGVLVDWEIIMADGLRKMARIAKPKERKMIEKTAEALGKNREAINRIEYSSANPRTILENLALELQWK